MLVYLLSFTNNVVSYCVHFYVILFQDVALIILLLLLENALRPLRWLWQLSCHCQTKSDIAEQNLQNFYNFCAALLILCTITNTASVGQFCTVWRILTSPVLIAS